MMPPSPSSGIRSATIHGLLIAAIFTGMMLTLTACITTHNIRTIGREAHLYKDARIQWVLLKDGTRLDFAAPGARYVESASQLPAEIISLVDSATFSASTLTYPGIIGKIRGVSGLETIQVKDVLEIAAEYDTRSGEKTLLLLAWISILAVGGFILLFILSGAKVG